MRALLVLWMLTLMSLQFSAAAVVAHAGHAAVASPSEHHAHAHQPAGAGAQASHAGSFDLDCGTCHANCVAALMASGATLADPAGVEPGEHRAERLSAPWHERPYRPQWPAPRGSGWRAFA